MIAVSASLTVTWPFALSEIGIKFDAPKLIDKLRLKPVLVFITEFVEANDPSKGGAELLVSVVKEKLLAAPVAPVN